VTDNLPEVRAQRASIVANENLVKLDMDQMYRFAKGYAQAAVFQGSKYGEVASPADLFVRISAGQAIGLDPYTSVSEMYFVKGKLVMSTNLQLALAKASGKYDYRITWGNSLQELGLTADDIPAGLTREEMAAWPTPKWCKFVVYEKIDGERVEIGETIFTLIDSWRAGLLAPSRNGEASNHLKYPRNMLKNRAGSNAIDFFMPDATMIRTYDIGEIPGDERERPAAEVRVEPQAQDVEAEETIEDAEVVEEPMTAAHDDVTGEVLPGESVADAMNRMVQEEAATFDPQTEPVPPPVQPPPVVTSPQDNIRRLTPGQISLVHVLCRQAGFTDERRAEVLLEETGERHTDKVPFALMDKLVERLKAEVALVAPEAPDGS
jgi:hypothetical protein